MIQNCFSMKPGTIFGYKGDSWKVIANDTLLERFTASKMGTQETKSFRYPSNREISIRWKP